ncbi:DUF3540 domain-containing protein [Pseudomonas veronii]|jgi:hypothetical protein|uniref:DUF3540 domain-containing protein n=1 Tax=Pseudomonas TaxID=286 RepID=UPI000D37D721|nr:MULTISPECIES: DUF3540 domain-containing protein [Pseudomonas]MCT8960859.1 DUF3540 domain-containing protein [Pseudomonas veronii]NMX36405.1 DUF3540 domain-containing protein [Pseudomonas veronii]NMX51024.1 DUF3540 domain-containing protein [Pseudomonas veronii]NWC58223.1 DUF3540 domain-containing protein [Pseudomonas veronii]PUB37615.1 uncharacterized protein DUF3540 [Pseudomonas sp. GV105]
MNEAPQYCDAAAQLRHAQVNALDGERFGVVSSDGRRYWLKPAFGCLVRPAVGDKVLVSLDAQGGYILSVLERAIAQPARMHLEGDLHLSLPAGALSIQARDGVSLDAGLALRVCAEQGSVQMQRAHLTVGTLAMSGEHLQNHWVERHDSSVYHREKAVRHEADFADSRRRVEGHEELHSGSLRQRVRDDWSVQADTLDLNAQRSVAIDGDSIKLG